MPSICVHFPAGRYHATPWGHHVNEGLIEWPPSPWRLLRSFLATGYAKLQWPAAGPPPEAVRLIEKLAGTLPSYSLPPALGAHSRHYMPLASLQDGRENTTMVFDTWARVSGELILSWDVDLEADEQNLLTRLVEGLGYLGRSESWVTASFQNQERADATTTTNTHCWPEEQGTPKGPGWEQVPLLAPIKAEDYQAWRVRNLEKAQSEYLRAQKEQKERCSEKDTKKLSTKQLQKLQASFPDNLIACLQMQTSQLKEMGWSQPPGSQRVFYWRSSVALESGPPDGHKSMIALPVTAVLLSLATTNNNEYALPPVIRTLPQAERLHKQLVGHLQGRNNPCLTGKNEQREILQTPHSHSHILPLDVNGDGHLDHILIWATMGIDGEAQNAIRATRQTYTKGGIGTLRLAWSGAGDRQDFLRLTGPYAAGLRTVFQESTEWLSSTPFIPPRHLKRNGKNSLEGQIATELSARNYPKPLAIERFEAQDDELARRQRHFIRTRRFGQPPPVDCGFTIRLQFAEPVQGPLCLGYGCHFGMGLFTAEKKTS